MLRLEVGGWCYLPDQVASVWLRVIIWTWEQP